MATNRLPCVGRIRTSRVGFHLFARQPFNPPPRSEAFAGLCSRQQYRPGTSCPEEKNAARGPIQGIEAAALLREAVGQGYKREIGSDPPPAQACPQAGSAGRADRSTAEEAKRRRQAPARLAGRACPPGPGSISTDTYALQIRNEERAASICLRRRGKQAAGVLMVSCEALRKTLIKGARRPPVFKGIRPPSRIWRLKRRLAVDAPAPQQAVVKLTTTFPTPIESRTCKCDGGRVSRPTTDRLPIQLLVPLRS